MEWINIKKYIISIVVIVILLIVIYIINNKNSKLNDQNIINKVGENEEMKVIINNEEYEINIENNETAKAFIKLLPLELEMNELNGNEKYYYLDQKLPTDSKSIGQIRQGDVMLYGDDCLVIFYKSFNTIYSYTKIGHIDNLPNLSNNNIKVNFVK